MKKRIVFAAVLILFVLGCASTESVPTLAPTVDEAEVKPPATATNTSEPVEEPTNTPEPTKTPIPTETPTIQIMCTAPVCNEDEIYICPDDSAALREVVLEVQVCATMSGHDLGPFEPVDNPASGYEARCRNCDQSVWVGDNGLMYSLLGDRCIEL